MVNITNLLNLRRDGIPSLVLPCHHPPKQSGHDSVADEISECKRVAEDITRLRLGTVQLRTEDGAAVADADLHGVCDCSLGLARHIDGRPRQRQGNGWVDTRGCEDGACVGDTWPAERVRVRQQDDVTDTAQSGRADDEDGSFVNPLRDSGNGEGEDKGHGVRGHCQKLRDRRRVAELVDDGRLYM